MALLMKSERFCALSSIASTIDRGILTVTVTSGSSEMAAGPWWMRRRRPAQDSDSNSLQIWSMSSSVVFCQLDLSKMSTGI